MVLLELAVNYLRHNRPHNALNQMEKDSVLGCHGNADSVGKFSLSQQIWKIVFCMCEIA